VFLNLLENAAKYAPGSAVEAVARGRGERVEISIVDHGEGVPPDQRDRVFERFTQLEGSATRTRGGTGLGLNIVRGLTEAMRGSVVLEETPGGGATFIVTLPRTMGQTSTGFAARDRYIRDRDEAALG
jgi:signal transduction histidine kinase